jgi:hypothetical protein
LAIADRLAHPPPPPGFDSLIVSKYPPLFDEFCAKCFNLLWRGSRDGFGAGEFHRHCDGRANTLTLIVDTNGNIFGGFTPVEWESHKWNGKKGKDRNTRKCDDSLRSFLFTLRNPHGVPPRKLALRAEMKQYAIRCNSAYCAGFGDGKFFSDDCNANKDSDTCIGARWKNSVYANDIAFGDFLTGAEEFTVKEIEVLKIAD